MSGKIATYSSFASSIVFDVISGAWGTQNLSGQPPNERYFHSITLRKYVQCFFFKKSRYMYHHC